MSDFELADRHQCNMGLDETPELIGFTNGVLEVFDHHVLFRQAKPGDHIFMNLDFPYHEETPQQNPHFQKYMKRIDQVIPDVTLRNYFFNVAGSYMIGRNSNAHGSNPQLARTKSPVLLSRLNLKKMNKIKD